MFCLWRFMNDGIYPNVQRAEYEKFDAINISTLIHGIQSMAHLKHQLDVKPSKKTPAQNFGIGLHLAVFEPSEFKKRAKVGPDVNKNSTEWKEFYKKCDGGDTILSSKENYEILLMRNVLRTWEPTRLILDSEGYGEITVVWTDKETGLKCRGIIDRFCSLHGESLVVDLKSCTDASHGAFTRSIMEYFYHAKAAWYLDALNTLHPMNRRFVFIAQEKDAPYCAALYELDDRAMAEGRRIYQKLLRQYAECKKTDVWPAYPSGIQPLALPKWAYKKEEMSWNDE